MRRLIVAAVLLLSGGVAAYCLVPRDTVASPELAARLERAAIEVDGVTVAIADGDAWRKDGDRWVWHAHLFEPDWYERNYRERDSRILRVADDGREFAVRYVFSSGFEDAAKLPGLIGEKPGWTAFTLQSPRAPEIRDYVRLRKSILEGEGDFLDNRVEPTTERAHGGDRSLRCAAIAPARGMVTSKASINTELLHFKRNDRVRFSAWYWLEQKLEWATLMDLETVWIDQHPGPRIVVNGGALEVELKWAGKPKWRQAKPLSLPTGRWVLVEAEFLLHESDGRVRVWQDGNLIIDGTGQTLPLAESVLNDLEVGLSATAAAATVYVDDVKIARQP